MTFKEAVERMRKLNVPYSVVRFAHELHSQEHEEVTCALYGQTARFGGYWSFGATWEEAFADFEAKLKLPSPETPPEDAEGPTEEDQTVVMPPAPAHVYKDDDIPF